eukprot:TRINITY_DN11790_c0_g1_i1.p1 TRINITY_DN11790_c0_g1~~TRINITY_DN11790_c0_g1_i1.p1  ORF type:complete len:109 (-),score=11.89 TRINITY_DN11790_c0_g1_i1:516-842(-)
MREENDFTNYNMTITNDTDCTSMLQDGGGTVKNITYSDFKITSNANNYIALFFSDCSGCSFGKIMKVNIRYFSNDMTIFIFLLFRYYHTEFIISINKEYNKFNLSRSV